ncbi:MAG: hypothetical protein ACJAXJ_004405, partial [Colwellia sp.]
HTCEGRAKAAALPPNDVLLNLMDSLFWLS